MISDKAKAAILDKCCQKVDCLARGEVIDLEGAPDLPQTSPVSATEDDIFDCLYRNVYADNDGVAGMSAFVEELLEKFDVKPKAAVSDTSTVGKYRADYSPLTPEEIAQPDPELIELYKNSAPGTDCEGK
jgi:hypothetical protein